MIYYVGTSAAGTELSGLPTVAGTYTVVANFAGSTDYASVSSSPATFTITQATPTVTISDAGGIYNGSKFSATALVAGVVSGVDSTPESGLETVSPTLTYYAGTSATGTALAGAPTSAGTYTVWASFPGSTDYTSGSASATFTISQATPSVSVSDAGGTYSGSTFPATTSGLEGVTPTLSYYAGTSAREPLSRAHRHLPGRTPSWPISPAARTTPAAPPAPLSRSTRPNPASR